MTPDLKDVAEVLGRVARDVILPQYGRLAREAVRTKSGPADLVTEVDEAAEAALKTALAAVAPGARFVGEESAARNPEIVADLQRSGACWVVDPLDGTRNFVHGTPEFGIIVAFVENGVTTAGWICAVPDGECVYGARGRGVLRNGAPLAPPAPASRRLSGFKSLGSLPAPEAEVIRARIGAQFAIRPSHCSAYGYLKLLAGEADFQVSSRIHAWDHVAGALLLQEAGGATAYLDGAPFAPGLSVDRALLSAAPGRDWTAIASALRGDD